MKFEQQLNINDRTLILGKPEYDVIPKTIQIDDIGYRVIGLSHGVKPPFVSLEIEKTEKNLNEKISCVGLKEKLNGDSQKHRN